MNKEKNYYFQLGDIVYHRTFGKGYIRVVDDQDYSLIVFFNIDNPELTTQSAMFTWDGRSSENGEIELSQIPFPPIVNTIKQGEMIAGIYLPEKNTAHDWAKNKIEITPQYNPFSI